MRTSSVQNILLKEGGVGRGVRAIWVREKTCQEMSHPCLSSFGFSFPLPPLISNSMFQTVPILPSVLQYVFHFPSFYSYICVFSQLLSLLTSHFLPPSTLFCCPGCEHWLKSRGFHHVAALLAQNRGNHESAVDAWIQLVDGESQDESFPGE